MSRIKQKGVSLVFVVLTSSVILSTALGASGILIKQAKALRGVGNSVVAFYAADAGIEEFLKDKPLEGIGVTELSDQIEFSVEVNVRGENGCPDSESINYCVKSIGTFQGARRAIEIIY